MPDQKRIFIIHGWGESPRSCWLPWLSAELKKENFAVQVPEMPDTDYPKIETWISLLREKVGVCDEETFFVGHSIGCQAVMRYLEGLPRGERVGGAVFVAPWVRLSGIKDQEERMTSSPWLNIPIDFEAVKKKMGEVICFFSDNDPYVPLENVGLFSGNLEARTIVENKKGHFGGEDGILEIPSVLEEIKRIAKNNYDLSGNRRK